MAAYGGEARSGNVRWDNSDSNRDNIVGLEVRWNQTSKPLTDADLEKRIDQYFEGIIKDARKRKDQCPRRRARRSTMPEQPESGRHRGRTSSSAPTAKG